jgi:hypothetical protein
MVNVFAAIANYCGFELLWGQSKDMQHYGERKDWLARNQDHVCMERYVDL